MPQPANRRLVNEASTKLPTSAEKTKIAASVEGLNGATGLWIGTQAQYDAIATKVATVLYVVTG